MKRMVFLLTLAIVMSLTVAAGVAFAATLRGTMGDDLLNGTSANDTIFGRGGDDSIRGNGGNDQLFGGAGNDVIRGGNGVDTVNAARGNDRIMVDDDIAPNTHKDSVTCGAGFDVVFVDGGDRADDSCEVIQSR